MIEVKNADFCIEQIANSGQCFRINRLGSADIWQVVAFGKVLAVHRVDRTTSVFHCSLEEFQSIWVDYFDLRRDYGMIKDLILMADDPFLRNAVAHGSGLRILYQDLWEVIVSFIISQRNNIPRIKSTIEKLCAPYAYAFPSPHILAQYAEKDFCNLGLGYRARYLMDIAENVETGIFDMEYLKTLSSGRAIAYLKNFNGIGEKVANCIALYGLHRLEAFPVDTWISRIIRNQYGENFNIKNFSPYAGVVQQYMFFYQRSLRRQRKVSNSVYLVSSG
ncbi:MAG: hypothetical protein LBS22_00510 [Puniceicoccales bacterium]|jgi:N-glycosylase/DNA lyase|nr:hypothetical protein [Puniceicoccales bacterium]